MMRLGLLLCWAVLWSAAPSHAQPAASQPGIKQTQLEAPVRALTFDQQIIVADEIGRILSVNPNSLGFAPQVLAEGVSNVTSLATSGDHRWVAAATTDGTVHLISRPDGKQRRTLAKRVSTPIHKMQFAPDGQLLGISGPDTPLVLWTAKDDGSIQEGHLSQLRLPVAISSYGDFVVARHERQGLLPWDVAADRIVRPLEQSPLSPDAVAISANHQYVAAAADKSLLLWDLATGSLVWTEPVDTTIDSLFFSADASTLLAVGFDGQVTSFDVASRDRQDLPRLKSRQGRQLAFDPATRRFAQSMLSAADPAAEEKPGLLITDTKTPRAMHIYKEFVEELPYVSVPVYYGTNRTLWSADSWWRQWRAYFTTAVGVGSVVIALALVFLAGLLTSGRATRRVLLASLLAVLILASVFAQQTTHRTPVSGIQYGAGRGPLVVGQCTVTVPNNHVVGEMESPPSFWVFKAEEDPAAHIMLQKVEPQEEAAFLAAVSGKLTAAPNHDAFVFIHGYNVTFEDAARRTAQLAVDLKFSGVPAFFSWPSHGDPMAYPLDAQNAEGSSPALCSFLKKMAQDAGAKRVHLIAHSMGNRVLADALRNLDKQMLLGEDSVFRQVVFAAPDIDREVFLNQIAPAIVNDRQHFTLYASSHDRALMLSKAFSGGPRAGDSDPEPMVYRGIETVDASGIDMSLLGHSYYADPRALVDLFDLLGKDRVADVRPGLAKKGGPRGIYWIFKPRATDSP